MALTANLDKATYTTGEKMTLTVKTAAGERDVYQDTPGSAHIDVAGVGSTDVTFILRKKMAGTAPVVVTDPNRGWTAVSDDGATAVYTATA